jgi:hypothetical protein
MSFHQNARENVNIKIAFGNVKILKYLVTTVFAIVKLKLYAFWMSRCSEVGVATSHRLDDRGVRFRVPVKSRILTSLYLPDRFWGPPSFLSSEYRG